MYLCDILKYFCFYFSLIDFTAKEGHVMLEVFVNFILYCNY